MPLLRAGRTYRSPTAVVAVALALGLPPLLRIAWDSGPVRAWLRAPAAGPPPGGVTTAETAALREALRRARDDLQSLADVAGLVGEEAAGSRYRLIAADVLSLSDPSPDRQALWIDFHGVEPPSRPAAVVCGKLLAGRLVPSAAGVSVARVQSLADPLFRVRFRAGAATGILWGTGRSDAAGHPLLEVHHCGETLAPGTPVLSAGNDGVFPPGFLIGELAGEAAGEATRGSPEGAASSGAVIVRASLRPQALERVVAVVDLAAGEAAAMAQRREP